MNQFQLVNFVPCRISMVRTKLSRRAFTVRAAIGYADFGGLACRSNVSTSVISASKPSTSRFRASISDRSCDVFRSILSKWHNAFI